MFLDLGGTIRSRQASETINFLKPHFQTLGITRVANVTGLDCLGVPVALCIRPNAKHLSVSQGKGITWELAVASAVMEAIENYHAENPAEPDLYGSYQVLANDYPVINPRLFNSGFFSIPQLELCSMSWIKAQDILNNRRVFIPHTLVCLDSTRVHPEYGFLSVSSNGLAAGNHRNEAICHSLYEIIERDSLSRWAALSMTERAKTQIKLASIDSNMNRTLIEQFIRASQHIKIWDITSVVGIPSFHCVMYDSHALRNLGMFRGTGTHLSKEIALSRALVEVAQSRLTLISGSRDDVFSDYYEQKRNFNYVDDSQGGGKFYSDCLQPPMNFDFEANVHYLLQRLKEAGYKSILMVDHTKPMLQIPVTHLFVLGAQFNGTRI